MPRIRYIFCTCGYWANEGRFRDGRCPACEQLLPQRPEHEWRRVDVTALPTARAWTAALPELKVAERIQT